MQKYDIGIDIAGNNMALTIISDEDEIINNYHYDITRGYSIRELGRPIHGIIYDMLQEAVLSKYSPENTIIKIEDQLGTNRICSILQAIIYTIFYLNKYTIKVINPRRKYANLKNILGGRMPSKKDLAKYIELDDTKFIFRQYNIAKQIFEDKPIDADTLPKKVRRASKEIDSPPKRKKRNIQILPYGPGKQVALPKIKPLKFDDIVDSYLVAVCTYHD